MKKSDIAALITAGSAMAAQVDAGRTSAVAAIANKKLLLEAYRKTVNDAANVNQKMVKGLENCTEAACNASRGLLTTDLFLEIDKVRSEEARAFSSSNKVSRLIRA